MERPPDVNTGNNGPDGGEVHATGALFGERLLLSPLPSHAAQLSQAVAQLRRKGYLVKHQRPPVEPSPETSATGPYEFDVFEPGMAC